MMMRAAEAYLNFAEADARINGGETTAEGNMTPTKKPDAEKRNAEREAALTFVRMAKEKGDRKSVV